MKREECSKGMLVVDQRTGEGYRVIGERVHATDSGAWVEEIQQNPANPEGVREAWVVHWSHLSRP